MGMGSTQTTQQEHELPKWYQEAAIDQINLGKLMGQLGYVPYIGADVAAFTPQQIQGMQGTNDLASAFGMADRRDIASELPAPTDFGGGIRGYSSFPMYEDAINSLFAAYPAQAQYLAQFSMDPVNPNAEYNPWSFIDTFGGSGGRGSPADEDKRKVADRGYFDKGGWG